MPYYDRETVSDWPFVLTMLTILVVMWKMYSGSL